MSKSSSSQPRVLKGMLAGTDLGDGLWVLPGEGNPLAAQTDDGIVMTDAGNRRTHPAILEHLRGKTDDRLAAILYSHGHHQYNAAVPLWLEHNAGRNEEPPRLIGHENILKRYARYRETAGLQARSWKAQFPSRDGRALADYLADVEGDNHDPTETFSDSMTVVDGSRPIEVIWAPSETDDCIAVWYPADGLLFGGPATPADTIPNIGTPLRTQRSTIRWAETLERLAGLGADRLLTEFGPLVEGETEVRERLNRPAEALRWLRDEVVSRMNCGMGEREILADMSYPSKLFDQPWMRPTYGAPDYIVRDLFREENGWWDRNPTTLHPSSTQEAAEAILSAITDHGGVLAKARELKEAGETQRALHVIDLLALAPGNDGVVGEARALKAELCRERAKQVDPYVSKGLYWSMAGLLAAGEASWQAL
jgi:uncharacterized sulfatase